MEADIVHAARRTEIFQNVIRQAEALSKEDYEQPADREELAKINSIGYDQWRDIRFDSEQALWIGEELRFRVQFFMVGFLYKWPVTMHAVENGKVMDLPFSKDLFTYGPSDLRDEIPDDTGFAGFRIHHPINKEDYFDEVAVFLGASYFRAVPKGLLYGLSARGLAVDTATANGEEFPFFKEFWIVRPRKDGDAITVYALLDSPGITGAYEYVIHPGVETVMEVQSVLFPRHDIAKLGIAPLTSMFFYGENQHRVVVPDFRPEVHDSDGLLILSSNDEWVWRPLTNPERLLINSFDGENIRGFGLLQRDMNYDHYLDLEARYDVRPSLWVTPVGNWGKGRVELLQIPTVNEYNDNISAYWVPEAPVQAGQRLEYAYRMTWYSPMLWRSVDGYTTDTRVMRLDKDKLQFVIDFVGENLAALPSADGVGADISISHGYQVTYRQVIKNTVTGGMRLVFQIQKDRASLRDVLPMQKKAVDLRALLTDGARPLTETWIYSFFPQSTEAAPAED